MNEPAPDVVGQNSYTPPLSTTPVPVHTPPAGVPVNATQGSPSQKGPIGVTVGTKMNTSRVTVSVQPAALVSTTVSAPANKPPVLPQSTVIASVPCPEVIVPPPPFTVQS